MNGFEGIENNFPKFIKWMKKHSCDDIDKIRNDYILSFISVCINCDGCPFYKECSKEESDEILCREIWQKGLSKEICND